MKQSNESSESTKTSTSAEKCCGILSGLCRSMMEKMCGSCGKKDSSSFSCCPGQKEEEEG